MKKAVVYSLVLITIFLSGCSLFKKKPKEEPDTRRSLLDEPVNQIAIAERPYISMIPSDNGQKVELFINKLNKPASEAEFELEYSAGDLIRGAFGSIDLTQGSGSYEVLLGSCSTGGTCSYDTDVSGGDAIVSLRGDESYAIKIAWRYQAVAEADSKFGSRDQKIQLTGDNLFSKSNYVIISETSGLPEPVEAEIVAGPFGVYPSQGIGASDQATVTLRITEESETAQIWGWNESEWVELDTVMDGKTVTTEGEVYPVYLVTK